MHVQKLTDWSQSNSLIALQVFIRCCDAKVQGGQLDKSPKTFLVDCQKYFGPLEELSFPRR